MSAVSRGRKVDALLWLAGGKSNRVAAEAAGVAPSTVSVWRRDPVFAAELVELRVMFEAKPLDGRAFMARLEVAGERLAAAAGPGGGGPRVVRVRVAGGASAAEVRGRVRRVVARDVRAALRRAGS